MSTRVGFVSRHGFILQGSNDTVSHLANQTELPLSVFQTSSSSEQPHLLISSMRDPATHKLQSQLTSKANHLQACFAAFTAPALTARQARNTSSTAVPSIAAVASVAAAAVTAATTTASIQQLHQKQHAMEAKQDADQLKCLKMLLSGVMSAVVTRTCMAPLERVKMDLVLKAGSGGFRATAMQVFTTEGVLGFWKGNALNLLRTAPFKALNFVAFDMFHKMFVSMTGHDTNPERFLAGACAGVTATLACFPLDVLRTRLMAPSGIKYGGAFETLVGMAKHEGPRSLYAGCLPAVVGMAAAGAVFYGVYDMLKHRHLEKMDASDVSGMHHTHIEPHYMLLYGALAGASSELIVYPLEVLRRRMQLQSMAAAAALITGGVGVHRGMAGAAALGASTAMLPAWTRIAAACAAIVKTDGMRGFYSGMVPNMLQVLPSGALSYYTYDTMKSLLGIKE